MAVKHMLLSLCAAVLLLAACAPAAQNGTPVPVTPSAPPGEVLSVLEAAHAFLADQLGVPATEIKLRSNDAVEWPNACLGLPKVGEICAAVVTPGFRFTFDTPQGLYEVRTDGSGLDRRAVRLDQPPITPATPAVESGIEGQVLIGPACPGPIRAGSPCPDTPYQATLTILNANSETVDQVETTADGRFRISLAPGSYTVRPEPAKDGMARAGEQTVTVAAGQMVSLTVTFDSGIR